MFRSFPSKSIITQSFWIDVQINKLAAQIHIRPKFETHSNPNTEVLSVNGFPRSGNTALWFLMKSAKKENTNLLSHTHDVIDLKIQLDNGSKCLVPFRSPMETVASLAVYRSIENNERAIRSYLKSWIVWHKMCLKLVNDSNLFLIDFKLITENLGSVLNWSFLNNCLNNSFIYDEDVFRVNLEKELALHDGQGYNSDGTQPFRTISMPNASRSAILNDIKVRIRENENFNDLRQEAEALHQSLIHQVKNSSSS